MAKIRLFDQIALAYSKINILFAYIFDAKIIDIFKICSLCNEYAVFFMNIYSLNAKY